MKTEDVITQLVGTYASLDELDAMVFIFYKCSKFNQRDCLISFRQGVLDMYANDSNLVVEKTYAIKATLEEPNL